MAVHWYVIQTKLRQEARANEHLQRQGYATYLPKISLRKQRRRLWTTVTEPLFPGYLFAHADPAQQSLAPVRSTLGVLRLVRFGPAPSTVPDGLIAYLKESENGGEAKDATAWKYAAGDQVELLSGPFAGLKAVYKMQDGAERALLLVNLLGRNTEVPVAMDNFALAH